jgi:hypothetical protein
LLSHSRNIQHFMKPEGILLCLQESLVPLLGQINLVFTFGRSQLGKFFFIKRDRLCRLVVTVPGYRSRDPGSRLYPLGKCRRYPLDRNVYSRAGLEEMQTTSSS